MAWALSGASERDIMAAIAANYPGADGPALLTAVVADLEKAATCPPSILIGWCFEATRELYRRMVEIGDFPGALRAVKQVKELAANVFEREDEDEDSENEKPEGDAGARPIPEAQGKNEPAPGTAVTKRP